MNKTTQDFIGVYENAMPPNVCNNLITDFESNSSMNLAFHRATPEIHDEGMQYGNPATSPWTFEYAPQAHYFCEILGRFFKDYVSGYPTVTYLDQMFFSTLKVQKTNPGQGYHVWHSEQSCRNTAHRFAFYIVYLNDVEEGGETEFLYLSRRVKPTIGTILFAPASFTHTHRGNPPLSGSKYIATGWIEW